MTEKHERLSEEMSGLLSKHGLGPRMPQGAPTIR